MTRNRLFFLVEPREVEIHSHAQHDLSANDPTAADRQPKPSAERDQAAAADESSSNAQHEPTSIQPSGSQQHDEPVHEQQQHFSGSPAPARPADAVGPTHVRSHVAEPDERQLERALGGRIHLLESAASTPHEHGSKSIHAVEKQRELRKKSFGRAFLKASA